MSFVTRHPLTSIIFAVAVYYILQNTYQMCHVCSYAQAYLSHYWRLLRFRLLFIKCITCLGNVIVALKCSRGNVHVYAWFARAAARMTVPSEQKVALSLGSACICFAWCMEWSECGMATRQIGHLNYFDSIHLILFNSS